MDNFTDRINHVKAQLGRLAKVRIGQNYTMLLCPFHSDGTPSGRVQHNIAEPARIGKFRCYACGHPAKWDELALQLNLEPFPDTKQLHVPAFDTDGLDNTLLNTEPDCDTAEELEFTRLDSKSGRNLLRLSTTEWRGFKFSYLRSVDAEVASVTKNGYTRHYLYFPVLVKGELRGYIKALPVKVEGLPGYFNAPGNWSQRHGLFLYDQSVTLMRRLGLHTLVLCEGPRDALRLYRDGIPSICILGTQSWSKRKAAWIEETGADKVILCMDGDVAGRNASRLIYSGIRKIADSAPSKVAPPLHELIGTVEVFDLSEYQKKEGKEFELDPCNAPDEAIADLRANLE